MIERTFILEWQNTAPWPLIAQIEQDLIISRALVNLYENKIIKANLAFKGGTALNKLFFNPATRYSEDIDLVQITPHSINPLSLEIRQALSWLGQPKYKLTKWSLKLYYSFISIDGVERKLKIEINKNSHSSVYNLIERAYKVENEWFSGKAEIRTYQLDELMGTKLKALFQRSKGRDLYDVWFVLKNNLIDCQAVVDIFRYYCEKENVSVSRAQFEQNLFEKNKSRKFHQDIFNVITRDVHWPPSEAFEMVDSKLVSLLPGKPWKSKKDQNYTQQTFEL